MSKINGIETEWTMLQRKHGNLPELEEEVKEEEPELTKEDLLSQKTLMQLTNELEGGNGSLKDEDERLLLALKQKRLEEMKAKAEQNKFGKVISISTDEYVSEVSKASENGTIVVCHLFAPGKEECQLLDQILSMIAEKHPYVKFVRIKGVLAIPNFPDKNCPTLLIYRDGKNASQIVGLSLFGGKTANVKKVEYALAQLGILKLENLDELEEEMKRNKNRTKISFAGKKVSRKRYDSDESDDSGDESDD